MSRIYDAALLERARIFWTNPARRLTLVQAELGITKNALVGLAHRRGWPLRRHQNYRTYVPLPTAPHVNAAGCAWPSWGDGPPTHEYCGAPVLPERPYCAAYAARAYAPHKEARADV